MRIGGLATGMDIDELVNKLMMAERVPLNKMQQKQTTLTWQRDAFRDVNKSLKELDDMMLDMKLSKTYNTKKISSTNESAVTATGDAGSANGSYTISVKQLATSEMKVGKVAKDIDYEKPLGKAYDFTITTYDKDGKVQEHSFHVNEDESLKDVMKRVNSEAEGMRMFYDEQSGQVVMETTYTGIRHKDDTGAPASEIEFDMDNEFFSEVLNIDTAQGKTAQNAKFTYNGNLELESQENSYKMNGVTYEFKNTTPEGPVTLTATNDVDAAFDKIKAFVDKYNEVVEKLNGTQTEEKYRSYQPLSEEQKKEMSEKEIELWEEKAKSGIIKGESIISNGLFSMRQAWYAPVKNDGPFSSLTEIGIKTTADYLDGGKLQIDEKKLKEKLTEDPAAVQKLFSNSTEGEGRGLVNRLEDGIESTMKAIESRAGGSTSTLENYTIGKNMKDLNKRIADFQRRLQEVETRYWNQFTAMEKAISNMNSQSNYLMSQFGGQ